MAQGLIGKLTDFLMPVEDEIAKLEENTVTANNKTKLKLHSSNNYKIHVSVFDGAKSVKSCADYLKDGYIVIANFEALDSAAQNEIDDFLYGVSYAIGGSVTKITNKIIVYLPKGTEINKQLFAYSVPEYVKRNV